MHEEPKITVLGSFVVDLMGRADHLPVPGETVLGSTFKIGPGGKGSNQAVAAHRAGGNTSFISKLGKDLFSNVALDFYKNENMNTEFLFRHETEPTGAALILVDEKTSQNCILVNSGACACMTENDIAIASETIAASTILLTQLETNIDILEPAVKIFKRKKDNNKLSQKTAILNPAPAQKIDNKILSLFDIITPNEVEASILSGVQVTDFESAERSADFFISIGVETVIITMGDSGVFIKGSLQPALTIPAFKVDAVDTTGAGDAFNGGFAAALSRGYSIEASARFGSATAALSVTKLGTAPAMPLLSEIETFLENN